MINGVDLENITRSNFPAGLMKIIQGADTAFPGAGVFIQNTLISCLEDSSSEEDGRNVNYALTTLVTLLVYELDKTNTKLETLRRAHNANISNLL